MPEINFGVQPTPARSSRHAAGGCVNFIREIIGEQFAIYRRPGYSSVGTVGTGGHRGAVEASGVVYIVNANSLYSMASDYTSTFIGNLQTLSGRVSMSWDGQFLVVCDGQYLYTYDSDTDVFKRHTSTAIFANPTHVTFSDGYHFIIDQVTGQIMTHQDAYNPAGTWNALDFATAEFSPDQLVTLVADKGALFMLGEDTTEPWEYDPTASALPLTPIRSGYMEMGCAAEWSAVKYDSSVVWLARDNHGQGVMVKAHGWQPQIISTPDLHAEWANYTDITDAFSQVWWYEGHPLLIITFPTDDKTWVYDSSQPVGLQWSEWQRGHDTPYLRGRVRWEWSVNLNGSIICGDYENSNIYKIERDTHTDNGTQIHWSARSPEIKTADEEWTAHRQLRVYMEGGVGLTDSDDQGYAPVLYMHYSDDHGNTWTEGVEREFGRIGDYDKRVHWHQLGTSRHRIYELYGTEPVKTVITGGFLA